MKEFALALENIGLMILTAFCVWKFDSAWALLLLLTGYNIRQHIEKIAKPGVE